MEQHNLYLPFLDIMINKDPDNNHIWMNIFYKKTDTPRRALFNCCHPKQCKKNIPFTLARRIFTIVENKEVRKKTCGRSSKSFIFPRISTKFSSGSNSKSSNYPH